MLHESSAKAGCALTARAATLRLCYVHLFTNAKKQPIHTSDKKMCTKNVCEQDHLCEVVN